ncbi:hypothetical protein F6U93_10230 [Tamlana haliotis]|uniref:Uncharacterized protein n=1 Tax=Pseudotamlana haliotis TaxID=2614804 RepID=A0A6N6MA67_9FLAO|nr:hypothetical protein [Tamlana haliotis]KAB1067416.1 hypothetical protein F6U93_10230 [Tamlana haliotis]
MTKLLILLLLGFSLSCKNEPKTIPLENIDEMLEMAGDRTVKDILDSFESPLKSSYLLNKGYTAPLLHGRMIRQFWLYDESY